MTRRQRDAENRATDYGLRVVCNFLGWCATCGADIMGGEAHLDDCEYTLRAAAQRIADAFGQCPDCTATPCECEDVKAAQGAPQEGRR